MSLYACVRARIAIVAQGRPATRSTACVDDACVDDAHVAENSKYQELSAREASNASQRERDKARARRCIPSHTPRRAQPLLARALRARVDGMRHRLLALPTEHRARHHSHGRASIAP